MTYVWENSILTFSFTDNLSAKNNIKITVEGCSDIEEAKKALRLAYQG